MESVLRSAASSLLQARIRLCQLRWQAGLQWYAQAVLACKLEINDEA